MYEKIKRIREQIDEWKKLAEQVTPGPWCVRCGDSGKAQTDDAACGGLEIVEVPITSRGRFVKTAAAQLAAATPRMVKILEQIEDSFLPKQMSTIERFLAIIDIVNRINKLNINCTEKRLQYLIFIMQQLCNLFIEYDFMYYMGLPCSFDLRDELWHIKNDGFLKLEACGDIHKFTVTEDGRYFTARYEKKLKEFEKEIKAVLKVFGDKDLNELRQFVKPMLELKLFLAK